MTRIARATAALIGHFAIAATLSAQNAQPTYAAGMAAAHAHETVAPSAGALVAPRMRVVGETVMYGTVGGKMLHGYLARPAGAAKPGPAIIMVHEWWGINDNIRSMADRYAGEGYSVLAVDLYDGKVATKSDDAMKLYQAGMADITGGEANVVRAVQYLRANGATSVGSVGYCFGGHWSLRTGLAGGAQINAVVMYYGAPITDAAGLSRMRAPLLGLFGGKDTGIPADSVRAMEATLKKAGRSASITIYPNAGHGFANPTGQSYDKATADDAWAKSIAFFKANLK